MNISDWKSQIKRGTLEFCILLMIKQRPSYGYEIISTLEKYPILAAKENTIYPLLRRLLKEEYISSSWQESVEGLPPRKYYSVTEKGLEYISAMSVEWENLLNAVNTIKGGGIIMEKPLNDYLEKMEKNLNPIPASERADIINEIKSEMLELQNNGVSAEEIIERLGNPKDLAIAYLGNLMAQEKGFSWHRVLVICAFCGLVGFSGMIVIPTLGIVAPTFIICGIACPCLGILKLIDYILELGLPFVENVGVFISDSFTLNPFVEFFVILLTGILLIAAGIGAWKLLVFYCRKVSDSAKRIFV